MANPASPLCRNFFLQAENYRDCKSLIVQRFGELLRKIWNTHNFKGQVRPLLQPA
jgi:U4/U6.U5 tri-snRNP-associated protein 2